MVIMSHTETFRRTQSAGAVAIVVANSATIASAGMSTSIGRDGEELTSVNADPVCQQTNSAKDSAKSETPSSDGAGKETSADGAVSLLRSVSETSAVPKSVVIPPNTPIQAGTKESASFPSLPNVVLKHLGLMVRAERESYSELEIENRFIALSLAFKTDLLTLSSRLELQKRHRDQAELNMVAEVNTLKAALFKLSRVYVDSDSIDALAQIQVQVDILQQATDKISGSAELFGAVQQEHRLSRATEVLVSHVENVKRSLDKMGAELEDVKRILAENNIILEDGVDLDEPAPRTVRYRSLAAITAKKLNSKRRASIAAMPRPLNSPTDIRSLHQLSMMEGRPRSQMANIVNSSMRLKSALFPISGDSQDLASEATDTEAAEKPKESMSTLAEVPEAPKEKPAPVVEEVATVAEVNNNLGAEVPVRQIEEEVKTIPRLSITEPEEIVSPKREILRPERGANPGKLVQCGILERIALAKADATIYVRENKKTLITKLRFYVATLLCVVAAWFIIWMFVPQK